MFIKFYCKMWGEYPRIVRTHLCQLWEKDITKTHEVRVSLKFCQLLHLALHLLLSFTVATKGRRGTTAAVHVSERHNRAWNSLTEKIRLVNILPSNWGTNLTGLAPAICLTNLTEILRQNRIFLSNKGTYLTGRVRNELTGRCNGALNQHRCGLRVIEHYKYTNML